MNGRYRAGVYRIGVGVLTGVMVVFLMGLPSLAHHILGIPHYAYDESYPQAPVIKYAVEAGPWVVELTGYPGRPKPGERAEMHAYLRNKLGQGKPYDGPLLIRVVEGTHTSEDETGVNIFGPENKKPERNIYIFHPTYPDHGAYTVKLKFESEGQPFTISFPITVGQPKSMWAPILWTIGFMGLVIVVVRAIAIKRKRQLGRTGASNSRTAEING